MVTIPCNLCGWNVGMQDIIYQGNEITLAQCPGCSLVFDIDVNNEPQGKTNIGVHDGIDFYLERKNELVFQEEIRRISKISPPPGRLLDFGCGIGLFLKEANSHGYDIYGIELNRGAVDHIRKNALFPIFLTIEETTKQLGSCFFDIIVLNHTLEHVSDPLNVLSGLKKLLKPSGLIVVVVPYYNRLTRVINRYYHFLIVKGHQFYFIEKTLTQYLVKTGFTDIEKKTPIMGGFAMRAFGDKLSIVAKKLIIKSLWMLLGIMRMVGLNINLTMYARKKEQADED